MKNTISHWTSVVLAGAALLLSSCSKDEDNGEQVLPIFPEMQDLTIYEGVQQVSLTFSANLDWTISLPLDAETSRWFQLSDGVMPASVISGKAGTDITIYVITHDEEEFDENPTCEVMLTMGGETKPIAKITRTNASRNFDIYLSGFTIDENTQEKINFSYEYSQTPVDKYTESSEPEGAPELVWFTGQTGYTHAFKVANNFDWLVSTPDWLTVTARPLEGEYFITADFDKITEQEVNGAIGIIDCYDRYIDPTTDPGNNAHNRYAFVLPDLTKVVRSGSSMTGSTYEFNIEGKVIDSYGAVSDTPCTGDVYSTAGLKFYVAVKDDRGIYYTGINSETMENMTDWVTIEDTWDENGSAFQLHTYTITVKPNEGKAREAILIALPKSLAAEITAPDYDLFNLDGTELLDQYKPYQLATIKQEGEGGSEEDGFSISYNADDPNLSDIIAKGYFSFEDLTNVDPSSDEDVEANAGEIEMGAKLYRLTYNNSSMSEGMLTLNISGEYTSTMINPYGNKWLVFADEASGMAGPGQGIIVMSGWDMAQGSKGDKGSIAFYGNTEYGPGVVARIICIRNY